MAYSLNCDFCGEPIENVAAKIYLAEILPGVNHSPMSTYSFHGDACGKCVDKRFKPRMKKRKSRGTTIRSASGQAKVVGL
jgi:hypothetical protein